jgi:hypothetical protein
MNNRAFTMVEILASLLLIAVGVMSVVGLMQAAMRTSDESISAATGMATAMTLIHDPSPGGLTADKDDGDKDGWGCDSDLVTNRVYDAVGTEDFVVSGYINGFWAVRTETSNATTDAVDARSRYATVRVEVYRGQNGVLAAHLKRRILRTW